MDWRTHALVAFTLTLVVFGFLWPQSMLGALGLAFLAGVSALLPDLDHEMSKGRAVLNRLVPFAALAAVSSHTCSTLECFFSTEKLISILILTAALVGVYAIFFTYLKPKHRGITHSLLFTFLYGGILYLIAGAIIALAGFIGYASHLLLDRHIKFF